MSDASNRYNLGKQPEGVERVWKALDRLGRKAKGGVPVFANNTALKHWIAGVSGRHELHGDRPKADAYTRCLQDLGIALASEAYGILIDLERLQQLRDYFHSNATWADRDEEALRLRVRALEDTIVTAAEPDAASVDDTVADEDTVALPTDPAERLQLLIGRRDALKERVKSTRGIQDQLTSHETELATLDRDISGRKDAMKITGHELDDQRANWAPIITRVERAQEQVDALTAQLAQAEGELASAQSAQANHAAGIADNERCHGELTDALRAAEQRYRELLDAYERLEAQKRDAALSTADQEELHRYEAFLAQLNSLLSP